MVKPVNDDGAECRGKESLAVSLVERVSFCARARRLFKIIFWYGILSLIISRHISTLSCAKASGVERLVIRGRTAAASANLQETPPTGHGRILH